MNIFKKIFQGNTLYYPGCLTKFVLKDILANYQRLLRQTGVDFIALEEVEQCCGSPLKNAGMIKEFQALAEKNLKIFQEHGVGKIITNCPACAAVLKNDYAETLGKKWKIEAKHITEVISPQQINVRKGTKITYHDSCHLGRKLGIFEQPRQLLKVAQCQLVEMELNREESFCCGGGGGVKSNQPALANEIAKERVAQAKATQASCLVTACPMCYANLKENAAGIEVKEMSQLIVSSQGEKHNERQ